MELKHDVRLDNVDKSHYRIWHDGQTVVVKKGESLTNPLQPEQVGVNTRVHGEITKGFFRPPTVDFTNTHVSVERFDDFSLNISRKGESLPLDPELDWYEDLGITRLYISTFLRVLTQDISIDYDEIIVELYYTGDGRWQSTVLNYTIDNSQRLDGTFKIVVGDIEGLKYSGILYETVNTLQDGKLPVYVIVNKCNYVNGNSRMELLHKNSEFTPLFTLPELILLRGEN